MTEAQPRVDADAARAEHRQSIRSVSVGTIWRLCRYPFTILSAIIIPAMMGDQVYGRFALFMSLYLMLDMVSDVGVTQTLGRYIPELRMARNALDIRLLHAMLVYGVVITLVVIAVGGGTLMVLDRFDFPAVWWIILCALLVLTKIEGTLFAFLYGSNQIGRYSSKELLRSATTFGFVLLGYWKGGLTGALWGLAFSEGVLLLFSASWCRRHVFTAIRPLSPRAFWPYFVFGVKFYLPVVGFGLLQRSGNVFIRQLTGKKDEPVAYFDVANQYLLLTATFLGLGFLTLLPTMTAFHTRGETRTVIRWQAMAMKYGALVTGVAVLALVGLGRHVIPMLLGEEFAPVYPVALVLSLALPLSLLAYAGQNIALLEKQTRVFVLSVVFGLLAMVAACLLLVPRWEAIGAAWASVTGYSVLALGFVIRYGAAFRPMLKEIAKVAALLVPCVAALAWVNDLGTALWMWPVVTGAYIALAAAFRVVGKDEIGQWMAIMRRA